MWPRARGDKGFGSIFSLTMDELSVCALSICQGANHLNVQTWFTIIQCKPEHQHISTWGQAHMATFEVALVVRGTSSRVSSNEELRPSTVERRAFLATSHRKDQKLQLPF